MSSIPGAGCGVCAKQHIPVGTWIGPYEGKRVKWEDVKPSTDTSYMWEVRLSLCSYSHKTNTKFQFYLICSYFSSIILRLNIIVERYHLLEVFRLQEICLFPQVRS